MNTAKAFEKLLSNIVLDNNEQLSNRYKEITKKLNRKFRDTDSEIDNSLQVGSYGRYTGIKGISDLDMIYIMPKNLWDTYKNDPGKLLRHTRDALQERWPNTEIHVDTPVVVLNFENFKFEIHPVFMDYEEHDNLPFYWFPDTKDTKYKKTKPKHEQAEMTRFRREYGDTHRRLCKIMRAWKNTSGLAMSGLLLDTLAYNFLNDKTGYRTASLSQFDTMVRDFFFFLKEQPKQEYYAALGSNQRVYVKHPFKTKASNAWGLAKDAIAEEDESKRHDIWRNIFGNAFPKGEPEVLLERRNFASVTDSYTDPEQFIENKEFPINISEELRINCKITANGFQPVLLRDLLRRFERISTIRSLDFFIESTTVEKPYEILWKVRNVGDEAKRRNCLRGEILKPNRADGTRHETSNFRGPHYVECYIIKNKTVIARDRINVPII